MSPAELPRHLSVAVLTFHRPGPLSGLLPMLAEQATAHEAAHPGDVVEILVVDNDPEGSAHDVVRAAAKEADHGRMRYVVEPRPGISAGRNRALDEADGSALLVFIDDDETPRPGWLSALVAVHDAEQADVVAGPVVTTVADGGLEAWVVAGGYFDRAHHLGRADGSPLRRAATNNLLLDLDTVRRTGVRFDDGFGLTGGEDSLFTGRLEQAGARLRWAAGAVVDDHLPAERLTRDYALQRTYHLYNSSTRAELVLCASLADRLRLGARVAGASAARLAVGAARVGVGRLTGSIRHDSRGHREIARAGGAFSALRGRHSAPYGAGPTGQPESQASARVLVAHPSSDLYGSDLQLVETVRGLRDAGHDVLVALPADGPLSARFDELGATVSFVPAPVLRKSLLSPTGLASFAAALTASTWRLHRMLRRERPSALLVNTVTIPSWLLAARLARVPTLCHVHEAEADQPRPVRVALAAPLLLAQRVVTNSEASSEVITSSLPTLRTRISLVYNGIDGPATPDPARERREVDPLRLVLVGRLSPRKGTDVALEALSLVRGAGVDASLVLCGSVFPGYEWFETQLRERAGRSDLAGHVELLGYVSSPAEQLAAADVVLVPSRVEPFGNAAVEALLAQRPLIASDTQGLREIVRHEQNGLLVRPDSPRELADAVLRLARDPKLADALAHSGRLDAAARFSVERYRRDMAEHVAALAAGA